MKLVDRGMRDVILIFPWLAHLYPPASTACEGVSKRLVSAITRNAWLYR